MKTLRRNIYIQISKLSRKISCLIMKLPYFMCANHYLNKENVMGNEKCKKESSLIIPKTSLHSNKVMLCTLSGIRLIEGSNQQNSFKTS